MNIETGNYLKFYARCCGTGSVRYETVCGCYVHGNAGLSPPMKTQTRQVIIELALYLPLIFLHGGWSALSFCFFNLAFTALDT